MLSLPGERVLYKSPRGRLKVTTHRLRYDRQGSGTMSIKSIMLEEVASCTMTRLTYPWLLLVAGLCVLGGFVAGAQYGGVPIVVGVLCALVCGVGYLFSRQQVVVIASAGSSITLDMRGCTVEEVRELIDHIEAAKNARYLLLSAAATVANTPDTQRQAEPGAAADGGGMIRFS